MREARRLRVLVFPLSTSIGIVKGIGNALPLWSKSRLLCRHAVPLIFLSLACIGMIANSAFSCMFPHQTCSSIFLLRQGAI